MLCLDIFPGFPHDAILKGIAPFPLNVKKRIKINKNNTKKTKI